MTKYNKIQMKNIKNIIKEKTKFEEIYIENKY